MEDEKNIQYRGANTSSVWLCLEKTGGGIGGIFFTPCVQGRICFIGLDGLLLALNEIFDRINFPQRFFSRRRMSGTPAPFRLNLDGQLRKPVRDEEMWRQAQNVEEQYLLCCYLRIEQRKRASWQGNLMLPWHGHGRCFCSELQLVELLGAALEKAAEEMVRVTRCVGGRV